MNLIPTTVMSQEPLYRQATGPRRELTTITVLNGHRTKTVNNLTL